MKPAPSTTGTWIDDAACRDVDPDVFYPVAVNSHGDIYRQARAVCGGCPVIDDCLRDALITDATFGAHGMRGGLTPEQRSEARRRTA